MVLLSAVVQSESSEVAPCDSGDLNSSLCNTAGGGPSSSLESPLFELCDIGNLKEEYKQIELIYGKKKTHEIMNYSYQIRQGIRKEIKEDKGLVQQV
jgi:hypothetical protein